MTDPKTPGWYADAFDQYPPVLDELVNRDRVIAEGYDLPDADGARSSVDRNYADTNNTFSERAVRESLKDLYLNASHKLIANSHDNSHFFKWEGKLSDWERCENLSQWYRITLPWNIFIYQEDRDNFKWSQFYHRWVSAEEMLNHWEVFRWAMLIFVDTRLASNYEVWVEEQEVTVRLRVSADWVAADLPVYIYRFDTGYQCRLKVSYRELNEMYHWDYPFAALGDHSLTGINRLILGFNLVLDDREPVMDRSISATLGENLEFVDVDLERTVINVGQITPVNVNYLLSKPDDQFWMTVIAPKFMNEYPILLPTDVIYRPWLPSMEPLSTLKQNLPFRVKADRSQSVTITDEQVPWNRARRDENGKLVWETKKVLDADGKEILDIFGQPVTRREKVMVDEQRLSRQIDLAYPHGAIDGDSVRQFYVDRNGRYNDDYDGWFTVPRPIVLSDAFTSTIEPYELIAEEIETMKFDLVNFTKTTDEFAIYIDNERSKNAENWLKWISLLESHGTEIYRDYAKWHDRRQCPRDKDMEREFDTYFQYLTDLRGTGEIGDPDYHPWLNVTKLPTAWFTNVRWLLAHCYELFERFPLTGTVVDLPRKLLWSLDEDLIGKQRFNRPVDASDFLILKYDSRKQVWRPTAVTIEHHFPDVYTISPLAGEPTDPSAIYKAFVFYSDTINVREPVSDPTVSKPQFDEELTEYQSKLGDFKQIFIEKFYWLAIRGLYEGLLVTGSRWEVIEFTLENDSYRRFNELFLGTSDPYFKLGLATYLRGANGEFPFDDAIAKLKEQMKLRWQGYERVTSFEYYLRTQFVQAYFDYLDRVTDDYDLSDRLWRRPPIAFSLSKLIAELSRLHGLITSEISVALRWTLSDKILPSEGGTIESEATDVSVDAYRGKLDWAIDQLTTFETFGLDVQAIRYLGAILNGIPNGLQRVISYLSDRDPDLYSLGELAVATQWLASFELAVDETERGLVKLSEQLKLGTWRKKKDLVDVGYRTATGELTMLAEQMLGEIRTLNLERLNRTLDAAPYLGGDDTDSLLANLRRLDYPWSDEIRNVYGRIGSRIKRLNEIYVPYRSLSVDEIQVCHGMITGLGTELIELRQLVMKYWSDRGLAKDAGLIGAFDRGDDLLGTYVIAIDSYRHHERRLAEMIEQFVGSFTPETVRLTENEHQLYLNAYERVATSLHLLLTQLWSEPDERAVMTDVTELADTLRQWSLYLEQEEKVFTVLGEVADGHELIDQLRAQVIRINAIVRYLSSLPTWFSPESNLPSYAESYRPTAIEIVDGGFGYEVGDDVHVPELGSFTVATTGDDGNVTVIGEPVGLAWNFRRPGETRSYHALAENTGFGLTVKCSAYETRTFIDDRLAEIVIGGLRVVARNLREFSGTVNPSSNLELRRLITTFAGIKERWDDIIRHREANLTEITRANVDAALAVISTEAIEAFARNRELVELRGLIFNLNRLADSLRKTWDQAELADRCQAQIDNLQRFFGYGDRWSDRGVLLAIVDYLAELMTDILDELGSRPPIASRVETIAGYLRDIRTGCSEHDALAERLLDMATAIEDRLDGLGEPTVMTAHRLISVSVGHCGHDFATGDLLRVVTGDQTLIFMVERANLGEVLAVTPLVDYALDRPIWNYLLPENLTVSSAGLGLGLTVRTQPINLGELVPPSGEFSASEGTISDRGGEIELQATVSTAELPERYDRCDLVRFSFNNIHDLDMNYEVFIGGHQVTDFYQRHELAENVDHPSKRDSLYLDANLVDQLRASHLTISPENYYIYRINGFKVIDPGSGYHRDQIVYLLANETCLRLKVVDIDDDPFKGIAEVELVGGKVLYDRTDPGGTRLMIVPDDMCNLDDEFHVNRYDLLERGTPRPLMLSDGGRLIFPTFKPETVNGGTIPHDVDDRNANFMYPSVGKPPMIYPPENYTWTVSPQILPKRGGTVQSKLSSETDLTSPADLRGDPEFGWYQGHRIDNSVIGSHDDRWNGIIDVEEVTNRFIGDEKRQPPGQPARGEYQLIRREAFFTTPHRQRDWYIRFVYDTFADRPKFPVEEPELTAGTLIRIRCDETHGGHRWIYRVREMSPTGAFRYDNGFIDDWHWASFTVNWMDTDWYPELPTTKQIYPDIDYHDGVRTWYNDVELPCLRGDVAANPDIIPRLKHHLTYIHDLTVDDLAVFNWSKKRWEDLSDPTTWQLRVNRGTDDPYDPLGFPWGFRLTYLKPQHDIRKEDMKLYLCKVPRNQQLAKSIVKPAKLDVIATIDSEVNVEAQRLPVNTSRTIRIRKLFPYRQSQAIGLLPPEDTSPEVRTLRGILSPEGTQFFNLSGSPRFLPARGGEVDLNVKMIPCSVGTLEFVLAQYMHFRNQVHLGDLKLYNHSEKRFEDIFNPDDWRIDIGNDGKVDELIIREFDANPHTLRPEGGPDDLRMEAIRQARSHTELQSKVVETIIVDPGKKFEHGFVWGYNREHDLHVYGYVTSDEAGDGHLLSFRPSHFPWVPESGIFTFELYQRYEHGSETAAKVTIEFTTETVEVRDDGYITGVLNRMAPIRKNVKLVPQREFDELTIFELFVDLTAKRFTYLPPEWEVFPTISIAEWQCQEERWYLLVDGVRYPLVNPSTGKRTLAVNEHRDGVDVTFVNVSRPHERLEFRTLPYPIRSAYTQRRLPKHGYLNLAGKLNKPLSKDYYEFWVNGKLLADEVTIITPTKLFLHGLTSLRNFEIVEINRDPHEYFSDTFLTTFEPESNPRPHPLVDLQTYLDGALEGDRMGDRSFDTYPLDEQAKLLEPVWEQVKRDHPDYRDYPENVDTDPDILVRLFAEDLPLPDNLLDNSYELMILDAPTIEGVQVSGRRMNFSDFKLVPIDDHLIISMLNEEWHDEIISDPYLHEHYILSDEEWYGRSTRLYDQFGVQVHALNASYYHVTDHDHLLNVDQRRNSVRLETSPYGPDLDMITDARVI